MLYSNSILCIITVKESNRSIIIKRFWSGAPWRIKPQREQDMTINEIAALAGVSRATVSRYLNQGYVSGEKRDAIRRVIEQTGYEPSRQARNLRSSVTGLIGVIIPRIQSDSISRMVAGIGETLSAEGYELLLANTGNKIEEELKYLKIFRRNQVDGVILMGTMFTGEHFKRMAELDVPLVVAAQEILGYSCVYQDDFHAGYEAARVLLAHGTQIGYIGITSADKAAGEARRRGFLTAMEEAGLSFDATRMLEAEFDVADGYVKAGELMERFPDTDSIFCATDSIAAGALRYLQEQKISVPGQVQLIGFGDTELGSLMTPAISTIHFYYKTTGIEAARMLLEILHKGTDQKKQLKMGFEVKKKDSTR